MDILVSVIVWVLVMVLTVYSFFIIPKEKESDEEQKETQEKTMIKLTVSEWIDKFREQPNDALVYIWVDLGGDVVVFVEPPGEEAVVFYDTAENGFVN